MASSARIDELRKKFDENPRRYFAPLANEYRKAGDLEQAIFICQEYLPQQPGHMSGHIVYGQALFELKRLDEAKTVFETALSLDPENLIALRHLGDIARQAGDTNTARIWYQRVLEADPRNEEIAQIMLELLDAGPAAPAASPVDHSAPTPLSTPSVSAPIQEPEITSQAPSSFEIEKATDTALDMSLPGVASAPEVHQEAQPEQQHEQQEESDLLDLGNFDVGGVPLSELRSSRPVPVQSEPEPSLEIAEGSGMFDLPGAEAEPEPEPGDAPEPAAEQVAEQGADSDLAFEADPFAIAAAPQPPVELATDLELGLPDDGTTPAADSVEMGMGLETFEAGTLGQEVPETPGLEMESFFELPEPSAPTEPVAAEVPAAPVFESVPEESAPAENSDAEPAPPFVTETMATLYLQQGHLEAALEIYQQLVAQRPHDTALQERLQAVADRVNGPPPHEDAPAAEEEPAIAASPASYGGPTIRDFLTGLLARATPVSVQEVPTGEAAPDVAPEAAPEAALEASPEAMPELAAEEYTPAFERRPTPSSSDTVGGSLGVLFSGADTAASNTPPEAANPVSAESAPLEGVPAHRASSELSLDHVFKSGSPQRRQEEGGDFSFDQFFADEAAEQPSTPVDTPAMTEGGDDIAQFNAWLNGLKKT